MPDGRVIACSVARFPAEVSQRVIRATRRDEERANVTQGMIYRTLSGPLALYDARVGAGCPAAGVVLAPAGRSPVSSQDMQATIDRRLRALERDPEFLEEDLANAMARRLDALDRALAPEAGALAPPQSVARPHIIASAGEAGRGCPTISSA